MPPAVSVALLCLLGAALLALMVVGWRRRVRDTSDLPAPLPVPSDDVLGAARTAALEATYVTSTRSGDWLDRVAAHGLGLRTPATVQVHDAGVVLRRRGAEDLFIGRDALRAVGTSPGMAGTVVGGDGLTVLTWDVATRSVPGGPAGSVAGDPTTSTDAAGAAAGELAAAGAARRGTAVGADRDGPAAASAAPAGDTPRPTTLIDTGLRLRHATDAHLLRQAVGALITTTPATGGTEETR